MFYRMHSKAEQRAFLLVLFILVTISFGGLVEIVPLFTIESTIERVEGVRPYSPLELAGRNVYVREGCYVCHSQMIRPMRDEVERYGHFSLAAESMYDHPFQWGSKRTGPDLARVGGKYSDEWHRDHLRDPRSVVPTSIMPAYAFLDRPLDADAITADVQANRTIGVPYTDDMLKKARADLLTQTNPDDADAAEFQKRYPNAALRDFDGDPKRVTEMDALVAYLQMLGTLVDFKLYEEKQNLR
jgi:cytochrome c oxidase cbb3-type subunit 2